MLKSELYAAVYMHSAAIHYSAVAVRFQNNCVCMKTALQSILSTVCSFTFRLLCYDWQLNATVRFCSQFLDWTDIRLTSCKTLVFRVRRVTSNFGIQNKTSTENMLEDLRMHIKGQTKYLKNKNTYVCLLGETSSVTRVLQEWSLKPGWILSLCHMVPGHTE